MNKEQLKDVIKSVDTLIGWSATKVKLEETLTRLKWYELEAERLKMNVILERAIDKLSDKIRQISQN